MPHPRRSRPCPAARRMRGRVLCNRRQLYGLAATHGAQPATAHRSHPAHDRTLHGRWRQGFDAASLLQADRVATRPAPLPCPVWHGCTGALVCAPLLDLHADPTLLCALAGGYHDPSAFLHAGCLFEHRVASCRLTSACRQEPFCGGMGAWFPPAFRYAPSPPPTPECRASLPDTGPWA